MQQVPLDIKITPSSLPEIESWRSDLLWHQMTKDDIVEYIRTNIKSRKEVKSGVVLFRDFANNTFQQISFSQRNILQPEEAQAIVKLKKPEPAKKPYTFEEKKEMLKAFILQNGRFPEKEDKFEEGPNLWTFYNSLIRGQNKYGEIIDDCKSNSKHESGSEDANAGRDDGSHDARGGRGRLDGRGGRRDDSASHDEEDDTENQVPVADEPEPEKKTTKGRRQAK